MTDKEFADVVADWLEPHVRPGEAERGPRWSITALAVASGVSRATLQRWLTREGDPDPDKVATVAKVLGVPAPKGARVVPEGPSARERAAYLARASVRESSAPPYGALDAASIARCAEAIELLQIAVLGLGARVAALEAATPGEEAGPAADGRA